MNDQPTAGKNEKQPRRIRPGCKMCPMHYFCPEATNLSGDVERHDAFESFIVKVAAAVAEEKSQEFTYAELLAMGGLIESMTSFNGELLTKLSAIKGMEDLAVMFLHGEAQEKHEKTRATVQEVIDFLDGKEA